ncbi:MAG: NUDIX domain-containing protein, partial [Raineya sp.]
YLSFKKCFLMIDDEILRNFGNHLRVRVCGICIENDKILLIKHKNIGKQGYLWSPPGGGLQFGESVVDCLKREFMEETNLKIEVKRFLFVHEFLAPPLHAIELFFEVSILEGSLKLGTDPEMQEREQILEEVAFLGYESIIKKPKGSLHNVLYKIQKVDDLLKVKSFENYQK